jgi:hypothetical protein
MADDPPTLTIDELIAYGLLWEKNLLDATRPRPGFQLSWPFLEAYVPAANKALAEMRRRAKRKKRKTGGRPRGAGMGAQVLRLVRAEVPEEAAIRAAMLDHDKSETSGGPMKQNSAPRAQRRKNPPPRAIVSAKNPPVRHRRLQKTPAFGDVAKQNYPILFCVLPSSFMRVVICPRLTAGAFNMSDQTCDDDLIDQEEVRREMGGMSVSSLYSDPELRALKVKMSAAGAAGKLARWVRGEVIALRNRRIAQSRVRAEGVRQRVVDQNERRRAKRRLKIAAENHQQAE